MTPRITTLLAICVAIAFGAGTAGAQDHTWTIAGLGGIGASVDEGGGSEAAFQIGGALQSDTNTNIWVKVGGFGFDTGSGSGAVVDGDLTYLVIGGEYQFFERYYHSGVFFGLGGYQVDGRPVLADGTLGPALDETSIGLVLGVTGEFRITPSFALMAELTAHILESDASQVLATGLFGAAIHF